MNISVLSRQDGCHVIHSRLPQAIYLYSSTLLALSNGYSKSFTQQSFIHFTIHTKGVKKKNQLSGQEILLLSRQRGETTQNSTISQQSQALVCCNWRTVMNPAKKGSRCSHRQSLIQIDLWSGQWLVFINHLSYTHSPWQSRRHIGKWAWNWWHRWGQTSGSLESSWVFQ